MELGPIFRALRYSKSRFFLVALEVALTLAVVVNSIQIISELHTQMSKPTGLEEDELIDVRLRAFDDAFGDSDYAETETDFDREVLASMPGVMAVAKVTQIPLSNSVSTSTVRPQGSEGNDLLHFFYGVGPGAAKAFGLEILEGRDLTLDDYLVYEDDVNYDANILVTQDLAAALFPDGNAVGRAIGGNEENETLMTIVGVVDEFAYPVTWTEHTGRGILFPTRLCRGVTCELIVRTEPGKTDEVYAAVEETLLARRGGRQISLETMTENRRDVFSFSQLIVNALVVVMVLLVVVTVLGIVGVTSFSVTQRRRQIGTRRALGATRRDILRYFLVENLLMTSGGLAMGVVLTFLLHGLLAGQVGSGILSWPLVAVGMAALWVIGQAATFVPALRGTRVPPVVATRCA